MQLIRVLIVILLTLFFLRGSIEDVHNIIGKSEYKYEVDTINEFRNFQIISIVDKTNFQLHCYNYNVFALDK